MDLALNPSFVRDLQEFCLPKCIDFAEEMAKAGADVVVFTNPIANTGCISRQMYESQVHPFTKRLYRVTKEKQVKVGFHSCGLWDDRFDLLIEEAPDVLWPDKVDIGWLKRKYGGSVCILGNVKTTEIMLQGTPDQVKTEALKCLREAAGQGGYLLGADCVLPRDVPADNVRALIDTAREYSQAGGL
jgi:uroporphyrinogen decarboxylase